MPLTASADPDSIATEPIVSVVVPTHGRTTLFLETLASLEWQTLSSFELIVTDDSPSEDDRRLIQDATTAFAVRTGRRARYLFSESAIGQARNTNQGLKQATGRFVRILHSDDLLAPHTLDAEVALLSDLRLNLELLHHLVEPFVIRPRFDRTPVLTLFQPSLFFRTTLHSSTPLPSATIFRRELLDEVRGMREDFDFLCDWDLFIRLVAAQHRRHRFIGRLTQGFVGWRVHADSTTGRLWHRHFLEHEQLMQDIRADAGLTEALIGDRDACDRFFARAVRYRYRRLRQDIARMSPGQISRSLPTIARCILSPVSRRERLVATTRIWVRRAAHRSVLVRAHPLGPSSRTSAHVSAHLAEPRAGWRATSSAWVSRAVVAWGQRFAANHLSMHAAAGTSLADGRGPATAIEHPDGPAPMSLADRIDIHHAMMAVTAAPRETITVLTEYNNSTNLWPLRRLIAAARIVTLHEINTNAFMEPVLHQCLKYIAVGRCVEARIADNQHLTSFGFKALIDRQFPGQFIWSGQRALGPGHHVLRYERRGQGHPTYSAPHTGWTFGMLTSGTRLTNVERFIESVEAHCPAPYEIVIVSPVDLGPLGRRPGVRVLRFTERDDLGWITKKKNLICEQASYSDILICHDRFALDAAFTDDFARWGYAYGLAAVRVRLHDGRRGLDWAVVSSQNHVWSTGGLLDYRAYSQYAYNPGGATVIRKAFWQEFPWNENLFWNEHEDVELCRRVQRAGGIIALSAAHVIAAEDRWVHANPHIPYCEEHEVLYGQPVGEQRIRFLPQKSAA